MHGCLPCLLNSCGGLVLFSGCYHRCLRDTPTPLAGKTEWEDALIKHGIMEAPEVVPTEDELALAYQEEMAARDPLAGKSLEQLDELEDDVDDQILNVYRCVAAAE